MAMDFFPTALELAGADSPGNRMLDGLSLKGLLLDKAEFPSRKLFFGYEPKLGTAVRDGRWKMIVKEDRWQLFNLDEDPGETVNLAESDPKRAAAMARAIADWKLQVRSGS